jgi:hypothetical protein
MNYKVCQIIDPNLHGLRRKNSLQSLINWSKGMNRIINKYNTWKSCAPHQLDAFSNIELLIRRGKAGLVLLNADWNQAQKWINERINKEIQVEKAKGPLTDFIVEPFVPHKQEDEYYVSIQSVREGDMVYFYHEGGVDVGDVDAKAEKYVVEIDTDLTADTIEVL